MFYSPISPSIFFFSLTLLVGTIIWYGFFIKVFKDGSRGSSKLGFSVLFSIKSPRAKLSLELKSYCLLLLVLGSS